MATDFWSLDEGDHRSFAESAAFPFVQRRLKALLLLRSG